MRHKTVLVIGSGMAGMTVAKMVSGYFENVIMLERDDLKKDVTEFSRKGIPQGYHIHTLFQKGRVTLEKYFPGLTEALIEAGANKVEFLSPDVTIYGNGHILPVCDTEIFLTLQTRSLIENVLRKYIFDTPNIEIMDGQRAIEFVIEDKKIVGIKTENDTFFADLIIDASGQAAILHKYLNKGATLRIDRIKTGLSYHTAFFRLSKENGKSQILTCLPYKPYERNGINLFHVENGLYQVSLIQYLYSGNRVSNVNDFIEYTKNLTQPFVYEAIKDATLVDGIEEFRFPENRWIHYENYEDFFNHVIPIGDTIARFDPCFGQGMTVSILECEQLELLIKDCIKNNQEIANTNFLKKYFKAIHKILWTSWILCAGEVCRYPDIQFSGSWIKVFHKYIDRLLLAGKEDNDVIISLVKVGHLLCPLSELLRPKYIAYALYPPLAKRLRKSTPKASQ